jgi:hypothetical protein
MSIIGDPLVELAEDLRAKRVKTLLPFWADPDETRLVQYAEMPRNSGLVDLKFIDEIVDRVFAISKRLDDAQTHRIGQGLKNA